MSELTEVYAKSYQAGHSYNGDDWKSLDYKGSMFAGYQFNGYNWVMCIKFTLPVAVRSLLFSFCNDTDGYQVTQYMRWKITSAEDVSLQTATSETPGHGTFEVNPGAYVRSELEIKKNYRAGTYYLYIWTDKSTAVTSNAMKVRWYLNNNGYGFYATYEKLGSHSWIKDDVGFRPYGGYIQTEDGPARHAPWIFTADGWKRQGG